MTQGGGCRGACYRSSGRYALVVSTYREYEPPVGVASLAACLWEQPAEECVQRVVPDGCVDVIWLAERELVIAGADTRARTVTLPAGMRSSGIRLSPGAAGAVLGPPAWELRDQSVDAALVWGGDANEREWARRGWGRRHRSLLHRESGRVELCQHRIRTT